MAFSQRTEDLPNIQNKIMGEDTKKNNSNCLDLCQEVTMDESDSDNCSLIEPFEMITRLDPSPSPASSLKLVELFSERTEELPRVSQLSTPLAPSTPACTIVRSITPPPILKNNCLHFGPNENALSLKRRMRPENKESAVYPSPSRSHMEKISFPLLIPLEDCLDSDDATYLPDTTFLRQKKKKRRRNASWSNRR